MSATSETAAPTALEDSRSRDARSRSIRQRELVLDCHPCKRPRSQRLHSPPVKATKRKKHCGPRSRRPNSESCRKDPQSLISRANILPDIADFCSNHATMGAAGSCRTPGTPSHIPNQKEICTFGKYLPNAPTIEVYCAGSYSNRLRGTGCYFPNGERPLICQPVGGKCGKMAQLARSRPKAPESLYHNHNNNMSNNNNIYIV
ncbi:hypothetical protein DFS34DRAFT_614590 [Phlyctochytrium arcticum]|nr:hypothetical protein DFS34DRAFT_614590 [Phlyctochytrium arcticum]